MTIICIIWITESDAPQFLGYTGIRGDSAGNNIDSVSTLNSTGYLMISSQFFTNDVEILEKYRIHCFMLSFVSV